MTDESALLTLDEAKAYLRVGDEQDTLVGELITIARALVEQEVGSALAVAEVSELVTVPPNMRSLRLRNRPVVSVASVTDPFGGEWSPDAFILDGGGARLLQYFGSPGDALRASMFGQSALQGSERNAFVLMIGTWTVVYTGGLAADYRWETVIKPALKGAALLAVTDLYDVRSSRATTETDGGQSHVLDQSTTLPPRAREVCRRFSTLGW